MSNSAISFNTAGLASTTSPGLVGTGAQTFAGKKTLEGGALIKGDTSGVGVALGYVGEVKTTAAVEAAAAASNTGAALGNFELTAGIWALTVRGSIVNSSGVLSGVEWAIAPSTNESFTPSVNVFSNFDSGYAGQNMNFAASNTVRGFAANTVFLVLASTTTYYLRGAWSTTGGGSVAIRANMSAVRIA